MPPGLCHPQPDQAPRRNLGAHRVPRREFGTAPAWAGPTPVENQTGQGEVPQKWRFFNGKIMENHGACCHVCLLKGRSPHDHLQV